MARSNVNYLFEADTAFVEAGTPLTITANGNLTSRVALDKMVNARADGELRDKLGAEGYAIVITISSVKVSAADEAYTFAVQATDAAGGNAVEVGSLALPAGKAVAGQWVVKVDPDTIERLGAPNDLELNVAATVAGTAPSVTVSAAWVAYDRVNG